MEGISLTAFVGAISVVLGILGTYIGMKRNFKQDAANEGKTTGVLQNDIKHLSEVFTDLKSNQQRLVDEFNSFSRDSAVLESKVDAWHKRLDELNTSIRDIRQAVDRLEARQNK
jgi:septal ring factor EnvC (AmiA/AmiB activator)